MKKIIFFCLSLLIGIPAFADTFTLANQTSYPSKNQPAKIAIQWANSAQEVNQYNQALLDGTPMKSNSLQVLKKPGTVEITTPNKAQYFRILVWSKGTGEPDLHTNWIDVIPNKTYTLQPDQLVPSVLMAGSGC